MSVSTHRLYGLILIIVRRGGLEPPRPKSPDPKSGAATNYATCAKSHFPQPKGSVETRRPGFARAKLR